MRSSAMTRTFRAFSVMTLAGASVLVFHSAALAQQKERAAKDAKSGKAEPAAKAEESQPAAETEEAQAAGTAAPQPPPPQELPPGYGPPPGYRHGPPLPAPPGYPPPEYGPPNYPPPGYGPYYHDYYGYPPPPRYYRHRYFHPAPSFYPEPAAYRAFFFGFGLGVGGVGILPNDTSVNSNASRVGLGYNLRFGFGVSPRWSILLSADGAQAYFDGFDVSETAWTIGPQVLITRQLYARAGVGAATYSQDACDSYGYCYAGGASDSGMAVAGAIGFEFMQSYHTALALEAAGTVARFPNKDKVTTFGINFVLNLF